MASLSRGGGRRMQMSQKVRWISDRLTPPKYGHDRAAIQIPAAMKALSRQQHTPTHTLM